MKLNPVVVAVPNRCRFIVTDGGHLDLVITEKTAQDEVARRIRETTEKVAELQRELKFLNQLQRELPLM